MSKTDFFLQLFFFLQAAAIVGMFVVRVYPSWHLTAAPTNVEALESQSTNSKTSPTSIAIPSLNLNLPISKATISDNQWTLFEDKVSWLSTSQIPGDGNVILYAHNSDGLFGNLGKIEAGAEIKVTHNGRDYHYTVSQKQKVAPTAVDAVLSEKNQLTLYTCDGSFDQKRLVVTAEFEKVET